VTDSIYLRPSRISFSFGSLTQTGHSLSPRRRPQLGQSGKSQGVYGNNEARPFPAESEAVAGRGYLAMSAALHFWRPTRLSDFLNSREVAQIRSRRALCPA
jgi:hypothetical protein